MKTNREWNKVNKWVEFIFLKKVIYKEVYLVNIWNNIIQIKWLIRYKDKTINYENKYINLATEI
jgi:hypothetical protein